MKTKQDSRFINNVCPFMDSANVVSLETQIFS